MSLEDFTLDFDSLIPEDLKEAVAQRDQSEPVTTPTHVAPPTTVAAPTPDQPATVLPAADDKEEDEDDDIPVVTPEMLAKAAEGNFEDDDTTDTPVEDEDTPLWAEDEEYKNLVQHLSRYGDDPKVVDSLLKKVVDANTVNNSKMMQNAQTELDKLIKANTVKDSELKRLKQLERAVRFEHLPQTKEQYIDPMRTAAKGMHDILDREGVGLTVSDALSAKNKSEFVNMLSNHKLEDADHTKIVNYWRTYKDLETAYNTEAESVQKDLSRGLEVHVSQEVVDKIFLNKFSDVISSTEDYKYLSKAVADGIESDPKAATVIDTARRNFSATVDAINRSSDVVHDDVFMGGLAEFFLHAAHNKEVRNDYPNVVKQLNTATTAYAKLLKEHKKLAGAAKGIVGSNGQVFINGSSEPAVDKGTEDFKLFLEGKKDFADISPIK